MPDWHREVLAERLEELQNGDPGASFKSAKGKVARVKFREFTATDL